MKVSAGILVCHRSSRSVLIVHPTNAPWSHSYSIPKGMVEPGESVADTAVREVAEEIGLDLSGFDLGQELECRYTKGGKTYKVIKYFVLMLDDMLCSGTIPKANLQLDEVDWAGYVPVEHAHDLILNRQRNIIENIKWED